MSMLITIAALTAAAGCGVIAWRVVRDARLRSAARIAALAAAIDEGPSPPTAVGGVRALFTPDRTDSAGHQVLVRLAGGFIVVAVGVIVLTAVLDRPAAGPASGESATTATLELLSMRHEQRGDTLAVTGLVRNHGGGNAEGITAVVFAFDRNGRFLASGRAPLDIPALAPGEESPFHVAITRVDDVGRYRVSFRRHDAVVGHVDSRSAAQAQMTVLGERP